MPRGICAEERMIKQLEFSGCASYGDTVEVMDGLREINFVYGPNGAGKTTVSRLIADSSPFSKCAVHWQRGTKLETFAAIRAKASRHAANNPLAIFTARAATGVWG